jgi:hypothetical protein
MDLEVGGTLGPLGACQHRHFPVGTAATVGGA